MIETASGGQAEQPLPMGVQGDNEPAPQVPLTQKSEAPKPSQSTDKMEMSTQDPAAAAHSVPSPTPNGQPANWNVRALGEPHTKREGPNLLVMVVADCCSALSSGTGGFAGQAAVMQANELGMAGKPVIIAESNPFPVDNDTLEPMQAVVKGCKWGKIVTLTTRG